MKYIRKGGVETVIKAGKTTTTFNSGFIFLKKNKITKKKMLEMAMKSATERFKAQFADVMPNRVTQKAWCY